MHDMWNVLWNVRGMLLGCVFLFPSHSDTILRFQLTNILKLLICTLKLSNWTMKMLCTGQTVHLHTPNWKNMAVLYTMQQRLLKLIPSIQRHVALLSKFHFRHPCGPVAVFFFNIHDNFYYILNWFLKDWYKYLRVYLFWKKV